MLVAYMEMPIAMHTGRIESAENGQRTNDVHARCVHGNGDHRLLAMSFGARISFAHEDANRVSRIRRSRDEPFARIDHVVVTVANDTALKFREELSFSLCISILTTGQCFRGS